jgi:glycosyltransferase involved in cell wall biosynthesis
VQQLVIGLAAGLRSIAAPDLEIVYMVYPDGPEWLLPFVESATQFKIVVAPAPASRARSWVVRNVPLAKRTYNALVPPPPIARSDGSLEALSPDIVHFLAQAAFLTSVTSIFHPSDLQHLHLPQYFSRREILTRERQYRAFCNQAAMVAVATSWGRDDILRAYGLPPDKVVVVPVGPVVDHYAQITQAQMRQLRADLRLPADFGFYPAQTWPHKNHERLLNAVAKLRRGSGPVVPLVFSGAATAYREHLKRVIDELGIGDDVHWVGFVEPSQLRALYAMARFVVVPTLFEAASLPIFEALSAGVPVACSNVTATPRQVGDAALIFDPYSVDEISAAISRLWTDPKLRDDLIKKGKARAAEFSWERTARLFAAHYRRLAGRDLSSEDQALLAAEPII